LEKGDASKLSVPNVRKVETILARLDAALVPDDLNLLGYRFHGLKGQDRGRYAVDASGNWRITFAWDGKDAIDIDLEDYH
jgi:toxin HigB-1